VISWYFQIKTMKTERLVILLLLTITFPVSAGAQLTVSLPSFPPFSYLSQSQSDGCQGVTEKLITRLGSKANLDLKIIEYPYARIIHYLRKGELDMALIFRNESLMGDVDYLGPVTTSKILVLTANNHPLTHYRDLKHLTSIAVIRKANFHARFDQDQEIRKIPVENYAQGLKMFQNGRVDGIIGSQLGLEYAMAQVNMDIHLLRQAFHLGNRDWWLHFSKKSPHRKLIPRLQQAIEEIYPANLDLNMFKQVLSRECQ